MNLLRLRDFTPARVSLGRAGNSIPTKAHLDFQLAHARARDAVHLPLDLPALAGELRALGFAPIAVSSAAKDCETHLRRPDLGRALNTASREKITSIAGDYDAVFVVAGGLSALAVQRHAGPLLATTMPGLAEQDWRLAPIIVMERGRVAIADELASLLGARLSVVLIGERPGLSSIDSLGVYLTWAPRACRTDAERNCISNIRTEGLGYAAAAHKLLFLMIEARRRKLSGVLLKDEATALDTPWPELAR